MPTRSYGTFMPVRYDQDTKAKAIRLVREHAGGSCAALGQGCVPDGPVPP